MRSYLGDGWRLSIQDAQWRAKIGGVPIAGKVRVLRLWRPLGDGNLEETTPILLTPAKPLWRGPVTAN